MKLKLIAAAALIAASGANAAITNTAGGNSDLFASIYSASQSATYVVDLGLTISEFRAAVAPTATGYQLVWDLDGAGSFSATGLAAPLTLNQTINYGNIFNTFANPGVLAASDLRFGVFAGDGAPSFLPATGTRAILTTSALPAVNAANSQLFAATAASGMDAYIRPQNEDTTNTTHTIAAAGANMYDLGDNAATVLHSNNLGIQIKNTVSFNTVGSLASPLSFYALSNVGSGGATQTSVAKYVGTWSFDAAQNQLIFAAVPEPETYAMLLAGLGLMGAIARRRKQK